MRIGHIGLGKMGGNMARLLRRAGIGVVGYDRDTAATNALADECGLVAADSGEGRWTALEGIEQGIPTPVMSLALMARFSSQGQQDYSAKLLARMRNQFGGHDVRSTDA